MKRTCFGTTSLLVVAILPAFACDAGSGPAEVTSVTDSAGIEIVSNRNQGWTDADAWSVVPEPLVEIGGADPREEYQLFQVTDAVRLSDGRIAVSNRGTSEIRIFGADGTFLSASGGQGEGPGEFMGLGLLHRLPGDTLLVVDSRQDRISLLDGEGVFVDSHRAPAAPSGFAFPVAAFPDRSLLLQGGQTVGAGAENGYLREDMPVYVARFGEEDVDSLGRWPGTEWYVDAQGTSVSIRQSPFGRQTLVAAGQSGWYAGTTDTYEIEYLTPGGDLRRIIRRNAAPVEATPDMIAAGIEERLATVRSDNLRRQSRRAYETMDHPQTLPAFAHLVVDSEENLWVMRFAVPGQASQAWDVFDPDGRFRGTVQLPARLRVFEIGSDYALALLRDGFDVETVQLYRLEKPTD